jgi:hypothetical protein
MPRQDKHLPPHAAVPYRGCILIPLQQVGQLVVGQLSVGWLVGLIGGFPPKENNDTNDALF